MSFDNTGSSRSFFDSSFDYRSLLPQGFGSNQNQSSSHIPLTADDIESQSSSLSSSTSSTLFTEYCGWELTWKERMLGCVTCMIAGYLLSLGSFFRIKDLLFGNPVPLVLNATIGNMIALAGSCFLSGPTNQLHKMFTPKRRTATYCYLGSLLITLIVVLLPFRTLKGLILLLLLLSQYISITWYCLSYIPMAQEMVKGYLQRWISSTVDE